MGDACLTAMVANNSSPMIDNNDLFSVFIQLPSQVLVHGMIFENHRCDDLCWHNIRDPFNPIIDCADLATC